MPDLFLAFSRLSSDKVPITSYIILYPIVRLFQLCLCFDFLPTFFPQIHLVFPRPEMKRASTTTRHSVLFDQSRGICC